MNDETQSKKIISLSERIGIVVKKLREQQGLSQRKLAEESQTSQAMISLIERGKRNSRINLESLQRISKRLDQENLTSLIGMAEEMPLVDEVIMKARELLVELRS